MENFRAIYFPQARDFSQKMNATFGFMRQNFMSLMKAILFIAGPPVVIVSILVGTILIDMVGLTAFGSYDYSSYFGSVGFWLQILAIFLFLMVAGVMTYATINCYIVLYVEKQTNQITVSEVWARVRNVFWMYVGTIFLFVVLWVAMYLVLLIPFVLFALAGTAVTVVGGIAFFCGVIYFMISISLTFFIRTYEKKGFFESIGRSMKLVSGKWWSTFGLVIILSLIILVLSWLSNLPYSLITSAFQMHSVDEPGTPGPILMTISAVYLAFVYLFNIMLQSVVHIGIAFQYFNLVELKESRGLMDQIESIGQTQAPSPSATISDEDQY